jgi:hypothetical protein
MSLWKTTETWKEPLKFHKLTDRPKGEIQLKDQLFSSMKVGLDLANSSLLAGS